MSLLSSLLSPIYKPKSNLTATTSPTVNDDITLGYQTGSQWFNQSTSEMYVCISNADGAAVWEQASLTIDDLGSMALQDADDVAITGGAMSGVTIPDYVAKAGDTMTGNLLFGTGLGIKASGSGGFDLIDNNGNVIIRIGSGGANLSFNQISNGALFVGSSGAVTRLAPYNTESLSGNKALTATSELYQFLNPNGSNRDVTLPSASNGMLFIIKNTGSAGNTLTVKDSGGSAITGGTIANNVIMGFFYNGSSWQLV